MLFEGDKFMDNKAYGIGKILLEDTPIEQLTRLYYSGMMPMPITKDGNYDFKTLEKIKNKIFCGYYKQKENKNGIEKEELFNDELCGHE